MRIELEEILQYFPKRIQNSHKGTYGKILNIAGSEFYAGAAILSSLSALKTGAGYVTLACPSQICSSVISYTPDITIFPLKNTNGCINTDSVNTVLNKLTEYDVFSIGSGLSQNAETQKFVTEFLSKADKPCVIDADALNAISAAHSVKLPEKSVITPHPRELSRLLDVSVETIQTDREKYAQTASEKYNCTVVLKGHETVVADGNRIYINKSGNSALAKAGSGDVLTGMISGIGAQMKNKDLFYAASLGVYLHGLAAETGSENTTEYGLLASEIIDYIPQAIKYILK
ncbi:MAG: NAD(P)H-hydrate dehydratase [Candidatus Gastranaerophilales bacterium]|nr:NAD(P)H-hydrate dehydratase [Candidatus Gastranaerophilales bacterium]